MRSSLAVETRRAALAGAALALAAVLAGLALPGPARAAAGWQAPVTLSSPGARARQPGLAVDGRGAALVVWRQAGAGGGVKAALRPAGGTFGAPQTVAGEGESPQPGFDASGAATLVWLRRGDEIDGGCTLCVEASDRPAGGVFDVPQLLPVEGAHPRLAVDPAGDAVVLVRHPGGAGKPIRAIFRPAGGAFGAPQTLAGGQTGEPHVAIDRRGRAIALWSRGVHVEAAFARRHGRFGKVRFVGHGDLPEFAANPRGDALAVWRIDISPRSRVLAAYRPAGGRFGRPRAISAPDSGEEIGAALDRRGDALAIWRRRGRNGGNNRIEAAYRPAGGRFGRPRRLSRRAAAAYAPQVAFDRRGNALAVWELEPGRGRGALLQASYRPAGGRFGKARTISRAEGVGAIHLAFAPGGEALAVWEDLELHGSLFPSGSRIRAAAFVP